MPKYPLKIMYVIILGMRRNKPKIVIMMPFFELFVTVKSLDR